MRSYRPSFIGKYTLIYIFTGKGTTFFAYTQISLCLRSPNNKSGLPDGAEKRCQYQLVD